MITLILIVFAQIHSFFFKTLIANQDGEKTWEPISFMNLALCSHDGNY